MALRANNSNEAYCKIDQCFDELHSRVNANRSISATTYLATDYLNHFNEVIMLLDIIIDMPDMLDELADWQPKSYIDHFKESALSDQDLIIEAYYAADAVDRDMLTAISLEMDQIIKNSIIASTHEGEPLDEISLTMLVSTTTEKLHERINLASGVINNGAASVGKKPDTSLVHTSINDTQATADILFD